MLSAASSLPQASLYEEVNLTNMLPSGKNCTDFASLVCLPKSSSTIEANTRSRRSPKPYSSRRGARGAYRSWELGGDLLGFVGDVELGYLLLVFGVVGVYAAVYHPDERGLPGPVFTQHDNDLTVGELPLLNLQLEVALHRDPDASARVWHCSKPADYRDLSYLPLYTSLSSEGLD